MHADGVRSDRTGTSKSLSVMHLMRRLVAVCKPLGAGKWPFFVYMTSPNDGLLLDFDGSVYKVDDADVELMGGRALVIMDGNKAYNTWKSQEGAKFLWITSPRAVKDAASEFAKKGDCATYYMPLRTWGEVEEAKMLWKVCVDVQGAYASC